MSTKEQVYAAVVGLLARPVVRFCVRNSISFRVFFEHARALFVREANSHLMHEGEAANISRIALRTGLSRREVQSFLEAEEIEPEPSLPRKVLGKWQQERSYKTKAGRPRPLTALGNESEFAELARSVSQDLNPYSVLAELEHAGLVRREGESVALVSPVYVPVGDVKKGFELASSDVDDLVLAVEENVQSYETPPHLHIKTSYDNIAVEALPEIRAWFHAKGKRLHQEAREFLSRFDRDLNPELLKKEGGARVAIGTFSVSQLPLKARMVQRNGTDEGSAAGKRPVARMQRRKL